MKIIEPGDLSRLTTVRRFSCSLCGCIWEAGPAEYSVYYVPGGQLCVCECPTCNMRVSNSEGVDM